jgi:hypothetical protein
VILAQDHVLFQNVQGNNIVTITLPTLTNLHCRGGRRGQTGATRRHQARVGSSGGRGGGGNRRGLLRFGQGEQISSSNWSRALTGEEISAHHPSASPRHRRVLVARHRYRRSYTRTSSRLSRATRLVTTSDNTRCLRGALVLDVGRIVTSFGLLMRGLRTFGCFVFVLLRSALLVFSSTEFVLVSLALAMIVWLVFACLPS